MAHAFIKAGNGQRHEIDFGDEPVRVEVHASEDVVEITVEEEGEGRAEGRRRFALLSLPRDEFSRATGEATRRAAAKALEPRL